MTFKFLKPVAAPPGMRLVLRALPKDGAAFAIGVNPAPQVNRATPTRAATSSANDNTGYTVPASKNGATAYSGTVAAPGVKRGAAKPVPKVGRRFRRAGRLRFHAADSYVQ